MKTPAARTRLLLNIAIGVVVVLALSIVRSGKPRDSSLSVLWEFGFVFIVVTVGLRFFLVHDTPHARKVNTASALAGLAVALCEPAIAEALAKVLPGGEALILNLWHLFFVLCCFVLISVFQDLHRPDRPPSNRLVTFGIPTVVVAALVGLSLPSVVAATPMHENPDWRFAAYYTLYALAPISMCLVAFRIFFVNLRKARILREIFGVATSLVVSVLGTLTPLAVASGAILMALGRADETLTAATINKEHGGLMLPFVAVCMVVLVPSIWTAIVEIVQGRIVDRDIRVLKPMWDDCTHAVPEVVLRLRPEDEPDDGDLEHRRLQLHRMRIEVADSLTVLAAGVRPLSSRDQTVVGSDPKLTHAVELVLACRSADSLAVYTAADKNSVPIQDLAKRWITARKYADQLSVRSFT